MVALVFQSQNGMHAEGQQIHRRQQRTQLSLALPETVLQFDNLGRFLISDH